MKKQIYLSPFACLLNISEQDIIMTSLISTDEGHGNMVEWDDFVNPKN